MTNIQNSTLSQEAMKENAKSACKTNHQKILSCIIRNKKKMTYNHDLLSGSSIIYQQVSMKKKK